MRVGYRVHGIKRAQDLTSDMAREQARNGWLTNNQYLAILANPHEYLGLVVEAPPDNLDTILNGQECLFMCPRDVDDTFVFDIEDTYGVTFNDVWRRTVKSNYSDVYEKREYTMRNAFAMKLIHYQRNNDADKLDKVWAHRAADALNDDITDHGQSSGQTKGVLRGMRGRDRGRGGRARGPN